MMESFIKLLGLGVVGFVIAILIGFLHALPVYLLWNWLMPLLFDLPVLTFMQALGLSLLCGLLFQSSASSSSK
jgi:hypothetical protein